MAKIVGIEGEVLAKEHLQKIGYKIIATNYKNKVGEIDIIALDKDVLVFVEVKCRSSLKFGLPREAVDERKQYKIRQVATGYLKFKGLYEKVPVRFDVIDVVGLKVTHIKNAF